MDPSLCQLFSLEEILIRLAQMRFTGCLHLFTPRESANLFFNEGLVIAAVNGLVEGEDVLKQILEWKEVRTVWEQDAPALNPPLKAIKISIPDLLAKNKSSGSKSTAAPPLTAPVPNKASASANLTATKSVSQSQPARTAQEEALLAKHKLILVSVDDPGQHLKIGRVSCLIGRNPACDIPINHSSISRQHCLMQITERGLHVKDLGSTNGTRVNGIIMTEGYVNPGDKLTFGHLSFSLENER